MGAPRKRRIADELLRLDIRRLRATGSLRPGAFAWRWKLDGEPWGSVGVEIDGNMERLILRYRLTDEDNPAEVAEPITLERTPCRFGGFRHWFRCPCCTRRAEILYMIRSRFRCRKCGNVGYSVENLSPRWRADRLTRELEARMNEDGSKPKWMRLRTWNRLCGRYDRAAERSDHLDLMAMARLMPEVFLSMVEPVS